MTFKQRFHEKVKSSVRFHPFVALNHFVSQWNNHPLSSEGNRIPLQKWTEGFYQVTNSDYMMVQELIDPDNANFYASMMMGHCLNYKHAMMSRCQGQLLSFQIMTTMF